MKKSRLLLSIGLLAFAGLSTTLTSCGDDDEVCPVGYEGKDCKDLSRDKFLGKWGGSETCTVGTDNYTVNITASGSSEIKIVLSNIYNEGFEATGTMSSTDKFDFSGSSTSGTTVTYSGTGRLNAEGELVLKYDISGAAVNSCEFTGEKL